MEELDPLAGIAAAVRRTIDERPAWRAEQAIGVRDALLAATVGPAWLGRDRRNGAERSSPGGWPTWWVLDRDLLACPPKQLGEVTVLATMVGGRWTHRALDGLDV